MMRRLICELFQDQKSDTSPSVDKLKSDCFQSFFLESFGSMGCGPSAIPESLSSQVRKTTVRVITARSVTGTVMPKIILNC